MEDREAERRIDEKIMEMAQGLDRADTNTAINAIAAISRIARDNRVSITLRFYADGMQEHEIEPWEPYTPTCPYGKEAQHDAV